MNVFRILRDVHWMRKKRSYIFLKIYSSFKIYIIIFLFIFPSDLYSINRGKIFFFNTDLPRSFKFDKNIQKDLQKILKQKIIILNEDHLLYRTNKNIKKLKENIKNDLKQGKCNLPCRNKINEILNLSKTDLLLYSKIKKYKNKYQFKFIIYKHNESIYKKFYLMNQNDLEEILHEIEFEIYSLLEINENEDTISDDSKIKVKDDEDDFYYNSLLIPNSKRLPNDYFSLIYSLSLTKTYYEYKNDKMNEMGYDYVNLYFQPIIINFISIGVPIFFISKSEIILDFQFYDQDYESEISYINGLFKIKNTVNTKNRNVSLQINKYFENKFQLIYFIIILNQMKTITLT